MLTAHAENTFIDNLSSLNTKNLFEETGLLQSLHSDVGLLQNQNHPILAVKSEKLDDLTPFDYINNLGEEWGIKFDNMVKNTDEKIKELNIKRGELENQVLKLEKDREESAKWRKDRRVAILKDLIDNARQKVFENEDMENILVEK